MATEAMVRQGPTVLTTSAQAVYTAPGTSGLKAAVRSIILCNTHDTSDVKFTLGIHTSAADAVGRRFASKWVVAPGRSEMLPYYIVINASEVIYAFADIAFGNVVVSVIENSP
jgi:hypothetical protein